MMMTMSCSVVLVRLENARRGAKNKRKKAADEHVTAFITEGFLLVMSHEGLIHCKVLAKCFIFIVRLSLLLLSSQLQLFIYCRKIIITATNK